MNTHDPLCDVIIVTYNSQLFLDRCLDCLDKQTALPRRILLVDTGSQDTAYLEKYRAHPRITLLFAEKEAGFCRGNNIGFQAVPPQTDYLFLLNPDAFIASDYLEKAIAFLEQHADYGAVTGLTLGFDIDSGKETGKIDTTGIFRTWYGKWFDRGHGENDQGQYDPAGQDLPAICGAVFFCRKSALDSVLINGQHLFDPRFYMYKEDIDLSLRLRKHTWKLGYLSKLKAHHCRGWQADRRLMSRRVRLCSARNELCIQLKTGHPLAIAYSLIKLGAVSLLNI